MLVWRTVPVQERSRRTVETILAAATVLLVEGGVDALTTSALAERTGLHVRNVYRYFPDRTAVIAALAERLNGVLEESLEGLDSLADPARAWRRAVGRLVDSLVEAGQAEPGLAAVRAALHSSPDLFALDVASDRRIAARLADALRRRGFTGSPAHLEQHCYVLVTAAGAVLDRAVWDPTLTPESATREVKRLAEGYLAPLLEDLQ